MAGSGQIRACHDLPPHKKVIPRTAPTASEVANGPSHPDRQVHITRLRKAVHQLLDSDLRPRPLWSKHGRLP